MTEPNEIDKLFENLPSDDSKEVDIFEEEVKPAENAEVVPKEEKPEEGEVRKNRRHRRLEAQLQEEREGRIAAEARANAMSESQRFAQEVDSKEIPVEWLQMYGDTPESRKAWKLNETILNGYAQRAEENALRKVEERAEQSRQQQREFESYIDSELEAIEDEFNVDVTSDAPAARKARREFLEMVQKLSPKDENGVITGYADFGETWEMYQLKREQSKDTQSADRAKELASRSMNRSGGGAEGASKGPTPGFRGWMKDFKL